VKELCSYIVSYLYGMSLLIMHRTQTTFGELKLVVGLLCGENRMIVGLFLRDRYLDGHWTVKTIINTVRSTADTQ